MNYTTTERKKLSVAVTPRKFRNILLGQQIKEYNNCKNLTDKTFSTERFVQLRHILKKYSPDLIDIQGSKNIVADA